MVYNGKSHGKAAKKMDDFNGVSLHILILGNLHMSRVTPTWSSHGCHGSLPRINIRGSKFGAGKNTATYPLVI